MRKFLYLRGNADEVLYEHAKKVYPGIALRPIADYIIEKDLSIGGTPLLDDSPGPVQATFTPRDPKIKALKFLYNRINLADALSAVNSYADTLGVSAMPATTRDLVPWINVLFGMKLLPYYFQQLPYTLVNGRYEYLMKCVNNAMFFGEITLSIAPRTKPVELVIGSLAADGDNGPYLGFADTPPYGITPFGSMTPNIMVGGMAGDFQDLVPKVRGLYWGKGATQAEQRVVTLLLECHKYNSFPPNIIIGGKTAPMKNSYNDAVKAGIGLWRKEYTLPDLTGLGDGVTTTVAIS